MRGRKLRRDEVDRLLREALADEPAPGDELRSAMRRAWAEARAAGPPAKERPEWLPVRLPQAALGIAAGLALILGLALHLSLPPRLVADSLSARSSSLLMADRLRQAVAMTCVLDTTDDLGRPRRYVVEWRAPDEARVRLEGPDGGTWLRRVAPSRASLLGSAPAPTALELDDPHLEPVRLVLSPDRIAGLLDGRVRVTVDWATGLPVRLEAGWTARVDFRLEEAARMPLVGAPSSAQ